MRTVDDLLRQASNETRELAARSWAPPLSRPRPRHRPSWPAFAAAFAAVVVTLGLIPWLARPGDTPATQPSVSTPPATSTPTSPVTTIGAVCSASGVPLPGEVTGLPDSVARTRQALIEAASRCDLPGLRAAAGADLVTSYGGGGADNLEAWEEEGRGVLGTLLLVLDLGHAVVDDGAGGQIYVWPAAFAYPSWDQIPDHLVEELESLYTPDELDTIATLGSYGGWRVGIGEDGDWMFFVAGD